MVSESSINVLIVDDHSMIIEGMQSILKKIPSVQMIMGAENAANAISLLNEYIINIAFIDINMPDVSGIELCRKIKKEFPSVIILALSTFRQRSYVSEMIKHGASGYILKSAGKEEIEEAITSVLSGKMFFSADINNIAKEQFDNVSPTLTRREKEILLLISSGLTNGEIAKKLFVSSFTVDTHRKNLLTKFEVSNTAMLITKAGNYGLL